MKTPKRSFALVLLKLTTGLLVGMLFLGIFDFQSFISLLVLPVLFVSVLLAAIRPAAKNRPPSKAGMDL